MNKAEISLFLNEEELVETVLSGKRNDMLALLTTALNNQDVRELITEALSMVMGAEMEEMIEIHEKRLPMIKAANT